MPYFTVPFHFLPCRHLAIWTLQQQQPPPWATSSVTSEARHASTMTMTMAMPTSVPVSVPLSVPTRYEGLALGAFSTENKAAGGECGCRWSLAEGGSVADSPPNENRPRASQVFFLVCASP